MINRNEQLHNVKAQVKEILRNDPDARNSDDYLYTELIKAINPCAGQVSATTFFLEHDEMGIPGFETVRRARQKVQEKHPELRSSEAVEKMKIQFEDDFSAFAING